LLEALITRLDLDRDESWMLGDTFADAGAAAAAHLRFALLAQLERCDICPFSGAAPVGVKADVCAPTVLELARAIVVHAPHL
jgi:phosphoglycolate phosphatase-like HAD superfamily hydrolase